MDDLAPVTPAAASPRISVRNLTVGYGSYVLMRDVSFDVARDDVFLIMGGSGCGKSTLLRVLMGLKEPQAGQVLYGGTDFWACTPRERRQLMQRTGVLFTKRQHHRPVAFERDRQFTGQLVHHRVSADIHLCHHAARLGWQHGDDTARPCPFPAGEPREALPALQEGQKDIRAGKGGD